MNNSLQEYLNFANKLADAAGITSMEYFRTSLSIDNKSDESPVTIADKNTELKIRSLIENEYPDHGILGEEFDSVNPDAEFIWVIDPIDGTRSFVIGNPTWSNLISLNYKGKPIVGLANFPVLKKYYLNFSDKVSYVFENGKRKKLSVNKKAKFNNVKVSAAFHGWLSLDKQKKIPQILKLMQFPCSDALSYSHLAEGRVDIVIQCSNKIWDIHPVIPIIKAAGGIISTWDNQDAVKAGNILVSANIHIHKKFLKLLKPVSK